MKSISKIKVLIAALAGVFAGTMAFGANLTNVQTNEGDFVWIGADSSTYKGADVVAGKITNYNFFKGSNADGTGVSYITNDLTLAGGSGTEGGFVRLMGRNLASWKVENYNTALANGEVPIVYVGPAEGSGDEVITIDIEGKSGLLCGYRNDKTYGDPDGNGRNTYVTITNGAFGGYAKFIVNGYPAYGNVSCQAGFWAEHFIISENATPKQGESTIDFLELGVFSGATAEQGAALLQEFHNKSAYDARILFNGGRLYEWYIGCGNEYTPIYADAGKKLIFESVNDKPIDIYKAAKAANLFDGDGVWKLVGSADLRIGSDNHLVRYAADDDKGHKAGDVKNNLPWTIQGGKNPDWSDFSGNIVLHGKCGLRLRGNDQLPWGADKGNVQITQDSYSASLEQCWNISALLLDAGRQVHLNGLICGGSYGSKCYISNTTASATSAYATFVLGDGDVDGRLAVNVTAKCAIEKTGAGTLIIDDVTFAETAKLVLKAGTTIIGQGLYDTLKKRDMLTIAEGATLICEKVINVASGEMIDTTQYTDYADGAVLRIRKTGAGTLTLNNAGNSFTGGIIIDGGSLAFTSIITPNEVAEGCLISNSTATASTITLLGKEGLTADGVLRLCGAFNPIHVLPDLPADFTQIFRDCEVPLESELALNSGTIGFAGTATATGVTKVTLGREASLSIIGETCQPFTDNQIVLSVAEGVVLHLENDLTVQKLLVDGAELPAGDYAGVESPLFTITGGGTLAVSEGSDPETIKMVVVPEGETVTGVTISEGQTLRKFGPGTLVLNAANAYSGGTEVCGGIVEVRNKDALGTGVVTVYGSVDRSGRLVFSLPAEATIANNLVIEAASSLEYPALHFASKTILSGTVHAKADLYLSTAWGDVAGAASQENVRFTGAVTVDEGACIGGAPHCIVSFEGVLTTPLLNCCYTAGGQASNGGNDGYFQLTQAANSIQRIRLDQTKIRCNAQLTCTNAVLEWVDNGHLVDDAGRFEFMGDQNVADFITPVVAIGGGGCVVTNIEKTTRQLNFNNSTVDRVCYARFDGPLDFQYNAFDGTKHTQTFTFLHRRHSMSGALKNYSGKPFIFGKGTAMPKATGISNSNSAAFTVDSEEEDVLDGMTSVAIGSTTYTFSEAAVKSLSKGRRVLLQRTTGSLTLSGTSPLHVQKYYHNTNPKFYWPAGEYTQNRSATTFSYRDNGITSGTLTGTMLVWCDNESGTRTGWTNMVWTGASATTTDINDLANWAELPQYATFKVPIAWVKFAAAGKTEASLANDVHWGGLTFTAESTGFTLKSAANEPTIHLYDNGLLLEKGESDETARIFTIEPTLDLQNLTSPTIKVPAGDKLVLSNIISTTFTADAENAGTIVLGGTIPDTLIIPAGRLEIAEGAILPAKFALISLGATAQFDVKCAAGGVGVESLLIDGTPAVDDEYEFGNLKFSLRTGYVPAEPTHSATWDGGAGEDTALTTAANWEGDAVPHFNAGAELKFAKAGTEAVVDGEVMVHSVKVENFAETEDEGPTAFTIKGASGDPKDNVLTVYGKMTAHHTTPLTLENMTIATPNHESQGAATENGSTTFTLVSTGTTAYALLLKNTIIEKPVCAATAPSTRNVFQVTGGVCEFKGDYRINSNWHSFTVDEGATLIFSGGISSDWKVNAYGNGSVIITNQPWYTCGSAGRGILRLYGSRLTLAVPGNYFQNSPNTQAGLELCGNKTNPELDILCDYAIDARSDLRFSNTSTYYSTIKLHGTKQKIANLFWMQSNTSNPGDGWIDGEAGACLWVSNIVSAADAASNGGSNFFLIKGETSFRKSGLCYFGLLRTSSMESKGQRVDHTSTGTLRVDGGTLELGEGVSWRNGPVEVGSSGTTKGVLKLSESGQLGSQQSLAISGSGEIYVPAGVRVRVASVTLDGEPVDEAIYPTGTEGSTGLSAHITGGGSIRIKRPGTVVVVH